MDTTQGKMVLGRGQVEGQPQSVRPKLPTLALVCAVPGCRGLQYSQNMIVEIVDASVIAQHCC